ncbi:DegT/DnrJ/EryC1/StrS family aminotransferase [Streptomyces antnestii]|uniref:DegT/DnrJ/EryC1/StrS family aminotransferase n=1 Tax=Streptomyces antnestii TaxID=2494256 RepID=A0A437PJG0_9ACTN|nr:DegT/DnrJ/EryC1/StrS family aminotransferase [Streptomyces sp. San01]RVU22416.1 DegT/DnrJ/EryC1/StrS family aminotransferase [Streptomyces sp. San01]
MTLSPPRLAPVPLVDLAAAHAEVAQEVQAGFARVLATTQFIKGPDVAAFEEEFAAFCGVRHCVGTASGTDAVELALRAAGAGPGDSVLLPANTFIATAEAVLRAGARPLLVDVDPEGLLMDPARVPDALDADGGGRGVKVLVPVHLHGQLAPMEDLLALARRHGLTVVEDAAQAHGAKRYGRPAGAWGRLAATSFYPGKNLGAYGDGGAVLTDDAELADTVRLLGDHGSRHKYVHERHGFNSRLDTLQAVVLRAKLTRLADWNARRHAAAERYAALLGAMDGVLLPAVLPGNQHIWHVYAVRVPHRDAVLAHLQGHGIGAGVHYPVPVHLQPAFRPFGYARGDFPVAERAAEELLSLPLFPHITAAQQERVADTLATALAATQ